MKNKVLMIISLGIFILLTFQGMINHYPFFDETHAWMLAKIMDFSNVTQILKTEGHPILWFLLIMPFAKNDIFFPYSIYIENYVFCLLALAIMWLKSPFETFYKIIITFSTVFVIYYAIVARCYSIGILGMFLLLTLYKEQIKRPILYSTLIGLTAHTNLLCAINASYLALVFIYKLFKTKEAKLKDKILSIFIISGFVFAWIYPYISYIGHSVQYTKSAPGFYVFQSFFLSSNPNIILFSFYAGLFIIIFFAAKDIVTKGFLIYTSCSIFIFMKFFYPLAPHHFIFLFINLIFAFWIFCINNEGKQRSVFLYALFLLLFMFPLREKFSYLHRESLKPVADYVNGRNIADRLYIDYSDLYLATVVPYIKGGAPFPERTIIKLEDIQSGYYLTRKVLKQYPLIYEYNSCYIYRIKR